jgi:hypothetical protein
MFSIIGIGIAYIIAKALDDSSDYKQPKGKNKNRYK